MEYELFLQLVKEDMEKKLGKDYQVTLRAIPKNNGVIRDGISICKREEDVAPTIYLNDFYKELKGGQPVNMVCDSVYHTYLSNPSLPYLDSKVLSSYKEIRDRIVYKLINTQANRTLLTHLPSLPFHDMSMVFYLLMEQKEHGYVTALIHKDHLRTWQIREKELFETALKNTPALLPPAIQPMSNVLKRLAKEAMGEDYDEETFHALLEAAEEQRLESNPVFPTLYVLTNPAGINGAACMAYPDVIKNFADRLEQDLIILPSSIHEVLIVADSNTYNYEDMSRLVKDINDSEVPVEDRLSNQIYRYSREQNQITVVSHGPVLTGTVSQ
ncbi:MAG: DUF5688 family protein [Lachnospiraceae bacterium]|nr:DUF5688 family protein [Lachnospiraceae bacterium]